MGAKPRTIKLRPIRLRSCCGGECCPKRMSISQRCTPPEIYSAGGVTWCENAPNSCPTSPIPTEIGKRLAYKANREDVADHFPDPSVRKTIEVDVSLIDHYDKLLGEVELYLTRSAKAHDVQTFSRLQSVPGIGQILALVILYEIQGLGSACRHSTKTPDHTFASGLPYVTCSLSVLLCCWPLRSGVSSHVKLVHTVDHTQGE
jgi:hypothetical protein